MSESENTKKVSNNDLRDSQFDNGIVDASTVNASQIGNNTFHINLNDESQIPKILSPILKNPVALLVTQQNNAIIAIEKEDEHKFEGKLVSMQVDIYEHLLPKEICVKLSISFGAVEVIIPNPNHLLKLRNETIDIKYGIKNGELFLDFRNGEMLLNKRENIINKNDNWKAIPLGDKKSPVWQFSIDNQSVNENQPQTLHGNLKNEVLGILELLDLNANCEINAYFKTSVNRINVVIIDFDDGTNKKHRETKIGLLLKYLKPELEKYVSKVVIRYESASLS